MDHNELIGELLQALTNDVQELKTWTKKQPSTSPDYTTQLQQLNGNLDRLRQQMTTPASSPAPVVDLNPLRTQLDRIEDRIQKSPEYRAGEWVKWGALATGVMAVLLAITTILAYQWKTERDEWEASSHWATWRLRYTKQVDPQFYNFVESKFAKDAQQTGIWIEQQEQADAKREAARRAQEQAAAMNAQADKLEGKKKSRKNS